MPTRAADFELKIDGTSLRDFNVRHLVSKIVYDEEVGKFDYLTLDFIYGPELDSAYNLLKHGSLVEFKLGYKGESMHHMMLGFIKGVKVIGSSKSVTINVAGYLTAMDQGEKERVLTGKTLKQVVTTILADYSSVSVGHLDNKTQKVSETNSQTSQTDLAFLEELAHKFGMYIKLEFSDTTSEWQVSMYEMGKEPEKSYRPYVMDPSLAQQLITEYGHLKEFDPESNVLGLDVNVSVVSVNPTYRYQTVTTLVPPSGGASAVVPIGGGMLIEPPKIDDDPDVFPHSFVDPTDLGVEPMPIYDPADYPLDPAFYNLEPSIVVSSAYLPDTGTLDYYYKEPGSELFEEPPPQYTTSVHEEYVSTTVVFECFGMTSSVVFQESVSSEEAQARIAEAIQNGKGFDFVVVRNGALAEGDPTLHIGQVRSILLNNYPFFGEAFSGDYAITKVTHAINRGASYVTSFEGGRNSLTVPPRSPMPLGSSVQDAAPDTAGEAYAFPLGWLIGEIEPPKIDDDPDVFPHSYYDPSDLGIDPTPIYDPADYPLDPAFNLWEAPAIASSPYFPAEGAIDNY